jgi:hypothetical protein
VRIARLLLICAAFAGAAAAIPTGGALRSSAPGTSATSRADATAELVGAFKGPDKQVVERGRAPELVGTTAPSLELRSFSGGSLPFTGADKPVVLSFVEPNCDECLRELAKLAALSVVYFQDVHIAAVAPAGKSADVSRMLDESASSGLILAGEDLKDRIKKDLKISKYPSTVIVGPDGTIDAMWSEPVPRDVFYVFLKTAYGLEY